MKVNIIDNWLKENTNPEIDKQVENEYKEIMSKESKEKAKELLKTFDNIPRYAKKAVDEIINLLDDEGYGNDYIIKFYQQVKQEILNRQ